MTLFNSDKGSEHNASDDETFKRILLMIESDMRKSEQLFLISQRCFIVNEVISLVQCFEEDENIIRLSA